MRERIRTLLRWLDARLIGDGGTFPLYRSTDGAALVAQPESGRTMEVIVADFLATNPALEVFQEERFRVTVLLGSEKERCDGCAGSTFWLVADFLDPADESWRPVLMFHESKLAPILSVLRAGEQFLKTAGRQNF